MDFICIFLYFTDVRTIIVFAVTFLSMYLMTRRKPGVPPGPPLWPVVGNLPTLASSEIFKTLNGLALEYGDIFSLYVGTELYVFLNGYDVINDAFVKQGRDFVFRPSNSAYYKRVLKHPGINHANGPLWKKEREFTQKAFKKICKSNDGEYIENVINEETVHLIARIKELSRKRRGCVNQIDEINAGTLNIVLKILYGQRLDYDDKRGARLLQTLNEIVKKVSKTMVLCNCFPWLLHFPVDLLEVDSLQEKYQSDLRILQEIANIPRGNTSDDVQYRYIDFYRKREIEKEYNTRDHSVPENQIDFTCYDLVGAGSETTATVLTWIIVYLIRQPNIQEKMIEEILQQVGKDRRPNLADRERLPYVQAVVHEGLRLGNVVPFGLPRSVIRDLQFHGYLLPKDCHIIFNIDSVHRDPKVFVKPDEFRPERFLDSTTGDFKIPAQFVPFNIGPRACVGQALAHMELFLITSSLVQAFQFLPASDGRVPDLSYHMGLTRKPKTMAMTIKERM